MAKIREWLTLTSAVAVVVAGVVGGMQWVVSTTIAPPRADMQVMNGRLDRMDVRMIRMEAGITALRERLTRVETLA